MGDDDLHDYLVAHIERAGMDADADTLSKVPPHARRRLDNHLVGH